jgi:zinc D-Ala-D-Ala carboxypeptidase
MSKVSQVTFRKFLILSISGLLLALAVKTATPVLYNLTHQTSKDEISEIVPDISFRASESNPAENSEEPLAQIKTCKEPSKAARALKVGITHYQYPEAKSSDLVSLPSGHKLHKDAAIAFENMRIAASKEDIKLNVISGFRSVNDQKTIVKGKEADGLSDVKIFKLSSYYGYSEHHTGYALDVNSLSPDFEKTKEGIWLAVNAPTFGFEMSFPKGNSQNVSFEPWHFRFVGTSTAGQTFCWASSQIKKNK